ncbi:hypothetical protein U1737_18090 [Sphingomonas sp. LB3N6]|uniref:hypothetical protein n=1 Tax=Sphingomonas fucosidasi TaxID=3096164 RepID=UPI002FC61425
MTLVDNRIGTFRDVEDMERAFISADEIEDSLFHLEKDKLITASMISSVDEPLAESDMIELTPRGLGYCIANEARVLSAALGGSVEHIEEVRRAYQYIRDEQGLSIDSSRWTGLTERLGPLKMAQIRSGAKVLLQVVEQSGLDGDERENALACARAVEELVGCPDPLWGQVISILTSKPLTAFLNASALLTIILGFGN